MASGFGRRLTEGEQLPYTLAIHRGDVYRMEQALQHVRDEITKAVKALATYAREHDDHGWSR